MRDISTLDPACFNCGQDGRLIKSSDNEDFILLCLNPDCELGRSSIEQTPQRKPINAGMSLSIIFEGYRIDLSKSENSRDLKDGESPVVEIGSLRIKISRLEEDATKEEK